MSQFTNASGSAQGGKLLDRCRQMLIEQGHLATTVEQYVGWGREYIFFQGLRHPQELGGREVRDFLEHVQAARGVKTQEQARCALESLYRDLLGKELEQA